MRFACIVICAITVITRDHLRTNVLLSALVNKGNCLFAGGDYEKAREYFQEAYNVEASCTEALFNLGMSLLLLFNIILLYLFLGLIITIGFVHVTLGDAKFSNF